MKITSAWIDDPSLHGVLDVPQLCVEVDELPDRTIQPQAFSGDWTVGKYGPFVRYHCSNGGAKASASDFNVRFRGRFKPVVDITLFLSGHPNSVDGHDGYSLPLTRARQLTRKYDPDWRLLINDRAAEEGGLLWLPVETNPTECRFPVGSSICRRKPQALIRSHGVEVPYCRAHIEVHNALQAQRRTKSS